MTGEPADRLRVVQFLWRLSTSGGIPRVARTVLEGIDRQRFDPYACTVRPLADADRLDQLGGGIAFHSLGVADASPSLARRLVAAVRLERWTRQLAPDVIHAHSGVGWYLLPWVIRPGRRCPVILEVHDSPQSARVSGLNSRAERFLLHRRRVYPLVHSRSVGCDLATSARLAVETVNIIPIGVNIADFGDVSSGRAWRDAHDIPADDLLVTYVARLVPSKEPVLFVETAVAVTRQCSQARFVLVGDGPERAAVEAAADESGIADRLLVAGSEPDLAPVLAASDVFLSTSSYEGFGIAIVEAMASSLPVVATSVGGVPELVVPGQTGELVPPGDVAGLVTAVLDLLVHDSARRRMGAAGRARVLERFDATRMTAAYEDLYESVVREAGVS
jgi:glycosyltransferase involved in cell wall biosynthesis